MPFQKKIGVYMMYFEYCSRGIHYEHHCRRRKTYSYGKGRLYPYVHWDEETHPTNIYSENS